jgi:hypothetical protein
MQKRKLPLKIFPFLYFQNSQVAIEIIFMKNVPIESNVAPTFRVEGALEDEMVG